MELKNLPGAWVLESFQRGGVDLSVLNKQFPKDVQVMLYEMDNIAPERIERLLQASAEISSNQDFGLKMNELVDLSMYGLFGYLLLNCGTIEDLFNTLVRYHSVHHDGGIYYKVVTQEHTVSIQFCYARPEHNSYRQTTDWGLGFIPLFLRPLLGDIGIPLRAQFAYSQPENTEKLQDCFGENLHFSSTHNQLHYPRNILQKQISNVDSNLLIIFRNEADKQLLAQQKESPLLSEIKALLLQNMENNKVNAQNIADALHISLSSLKRKLAHENIDFKIIKSSLRNRLAKQLLSGTSLIIYEIAQKTGFKNPSSFTRFFNQQNQQTPQAFRRERVAKKAII